MEWGIASECGGTRDVHWRDSACWSNTALAECNLRRMLNLATQSHLMREASRSIYTSLSLIRLNALNHDCKVTDVSDDAGVRSHRRRVSGECRTYRDQNRATEKSLSHNCTTFSAL